MLSDIKLIRYLQIFCFISLPLIAFTLVYNHTLSIDIINYMENNNDNSNNTNLYAHGHILVDKEVKL